MTKSRRPETPERAILGVLLYEFRSYQAAESVRKIKRRLRYHKLGAYDADRVEVLRRLKDSLRAELELGGRSNFFIGCKGPHTALEDFDVARLIDEYSDNFPDVARDDIAWFVPFAIFTYYLR